MTNGGLPKRVGSGGDTRRQSPDRMAAYRHRAAEAVTNPVDRRAKLVRTEDVERLAEYTQRARPRSEAAPVESLPARTTQPEAPDYGRARRQARCTTCLAAHTKRCLCCLALPAVCALHRPCPAASFGLLMPWRCYGKKKGDVIPVSDSYVASPKVPR
jgi:hypothetical protein